MLLGAHEPTKGGLHNAFDLAVEDGCEALQIFTKSPQQWKAPEITDEEAELFSTAWEASPVGPIVVHDSYLINLANPDGRKRHIAAAAFAEEITRCDRLKIPYLVFHPGAHLQKGKNDDTEVVAAALQRIADSLDEAFDRNADSQTTVLLENTAGQGTYLGHRFEQLAEIIELADCEERLGVCFDTCHAYSAGHDIVGDYDGVWKEFDSTIGFGRLKALHLNDSKFGIGTRKDRHEQIGDGEVGLEPFKRLVNDERLRDIPGLLETPDIDKKDRGYAKNLKVLRSLID